MTDYLVERHSTPVGRQRCARHGGVERRFDGLRQSTRVEGRFRNHKPKRCAVLFERRVNLVQGDQSRRLCSRLEFHYVPKHASWLNMVEIEIGILSAQCLDRRIPDLPTLIAEATRLKRVARQ